LVQTPREPRSKKRASNAGSASANGAGKLWGGRFEQPTDKLVEAYTSSIAADARLLPDDVAASIAHARMLGRQRIIPKKDADAIVRGLAEILEEYARGEFVLRDDLEDVHMNVEARLAEKIGPAAGRLHTARSRNDQVATDFRMYVKGATVRAISRLIALQSALLDLAEANKGAVMPGHTYSPARAAGAARAPPARVLREMFQRDATRFAFALDLMDELPLGSGALAGVPYAIDREFVAAQLGFTRITTNSIDAVSDRDFVVDYLSAAALTAVHLSRLAEELVLWSSAEFAFIRLPDAFATVNFDTAVQCA
jgi:argininosuccinate lyase